MHCTARAAAVVLALAFAPSAFADEAAIRHNIGERVPNFPQHVPNFAARAGAGRRSSGHAGLETDGSGSGEC